MTQPFSYVIVPSTFGAVGVVWQEAEATPRVQRVFLPDPQTSTRDLIRRAFPDATSSSSPAIAELDERIQRFLEGEALGFDLDIVALERTSEFQRRVLLAEESIPRGWVSTYGRLARNLGIPGAARAVGGALARNPFPIIIPCHRTIRSDRSLGGFQGGPGMKAALLELEGVEISDRGKVLVDRFYY